MWYLVIQLYSSAQTLVHLYMVFPSIHKVCSYIQRHTYVRQMHLHSSTSISSKEEHKSLLHDCHNWQLYFHFHLGIAAFHWGNSKGKQICEGDSERASTIRLSMWACMYVYKDLHLWSGLARPCPHTLNDWHPFVFATSFTRPHTDTHIYISALPL